MRRRLSNIYVLFFAAIALLLGLAVSTYIQIDALIASSDLVEHTTIITQKIDEALSAAKDAETAHRGYLLTGDTSFLEPNIGIMDKMNIILQSIDSLVNDDEKQIANLRSFRSSLLLRVRHLNSLKIHTIPIIHPDTLYNYFHEGEIEMDTARSRAALMIQRERVLRTQQIKTNRNNIFFTQLLMIILSIALAISATITFFIIKRKYREEMNLKRQLEERNRLLELSNKELASFNTIASHDLQEPLRKIITFSKRILETEMNISEKGHDYFRRLISSCSRMQDLIKALFEYSQLSLNGKHLTHIDLNDVIVEVKKNLYYLMEEKRAIIECETLPIIYGEAHQIYLLFCNLVDNSLKFSKPGIPPVIKISCEFIADFQIGGRHLQNYWSISLQDNGIGFSPEYNEKIFELFEQLSAYQGTGIGLAICKKIAENHNGYIIAKGNPGIGATFEILIPASTPDSPK